MESNDRFLVLLLRFESDIRAFIGSAIVDAHARDDIFQEVALTLCHKFETYDPQFSFGAWARGIAANKVLEERKRNARFPVRFSPETIHALLDAFNRTEHQAPVRADALQECVKLLPQDARQILTFRYHDDLKPPEIARRTGRTIEAVYQSLSRLRAKLEECVRRRLSLELGEAS